MYLDDILFAWKNDQDHLANLEAVLSHMESAGVRLKRFKCAFMLHSQDYLGHRISAAGLQLMSEKIRAIKDAPLPSDVSQLKSFLGLISYYGKFLSNLLSGLSLLYRLLQQEVRSSWGTAEQQAFEKAKESLTSECLLMHYDPNLPLVLASDASPCGIRAIHSH